MQHRHRVVERVEGVVPVAVPDLREEVLERRLLHTERVHRSMGVHYLVAVREESGLGVREDVEVPAGAVGEEG